MVDFNAEATVSSSAYDILRVLILQRRNDVIDAIESYLKIEEHSTPDTNIIRARMFSLFLEIQAMLKRKHRPDEYDSIKLLCTDKDFVKLQDVFLIINEFLDENRLIRIDTKEIYDKTRVSKEDKAKGI